jgi:hypothetical protein
MGMRSMTLRALRASVVGVRKATPAVLNKTKQAACATGRGAKAAGKATATFSKDTVSTVKDAWNEDLS